MKLQQFEYVLAIVDHDNHLSAAANALHTSQPGVSRQLRMLESELGLEIFRRTKNRIIELTEPGKLIVQTARRIMSDVDSLSALESDLASIDHGTLSIATTHSQARHTLPGVISSFVKDHPDVHVTLMQGDVEGVYEMASSGEADLAIGCESQRPFPGLVSLPCFELKRALIAPVGHPILDLEEIELSDIAQYPMISYNRRFSGHWKVQAAFERAGLTTNVVLNAIDADVCKTYVEMGLGLAILTAVCFDEKNDPGLRSRSVAHLFDSSMTYVRLRPNVYPRPYLLEFIRRYAPRYTSERVIRALADANRAY